MRKSLQSNSLKRSTAEQQKQQEVLPPAVQQKSALTNQKVTDQQFIVTNTLQQKRKSPTTQMFRVKPKTQQGRRKITPTNLGKNKRFLKVGSESLTPSKENTSNYPDIKQGMNRDIRTSTSKQNQQPTYKEYNKISQLPQRELKKLYHQEKDERYRYLLKYGIIRRIENENKMLYAELPQIPGVWVIYRKPSHRALQPEKLNLDKKNLSHFPLLEGEEQLKLLSCQKNSIPKIENLVSLPNLIYLDLYDNQIRDIENLHTIPTLRVVMLSKNKIQKIKNLEFLTKLEVLDLHSNQIESIEGLQTNKNLKILNLSNNKIKLISGLDNQKNLQELNLKSNKIGKISGLEMTTSLVKLNLANNLVSKIQEIVKLKKLRKLKHLWIEGNPISPGPNYFKIIQNTVPELQFIDGKNFQIITQEILQSNKPSQQTYYNQQEVPNKLLPLQQSTNSDHHKTADTEILDNQGEAKKQEKTTTPSNKKKDSDQNEQELFNNLSRKWKKESLRIEDLEKKGRVRKRDLLRDSAIDEGYAELEGNDTLYVYGNAYEIVLSNSDFHPIIKKINFQFFLFDGLVQSKYLSYLKKFEYLEEIVIKDSYINCFLQISKLEALPYLKHLTIENNPICKCSHLRFFIVYRFPNLDYINSKEVSEKDRKTAKYKFQMFDKILQIPEKLFRHSATQRGSKQTSKDVNENAFTCVAKVLKDVIKDDQKQRQFNQSWGEYFDALIEKTLTTEYVEKLYPQ